MSSKIRSWPAWPITFAVVLLCGSVVMCRREVGEAINDASRWTAADGKPLDNIGDGVKCPECGGVIWWQKDGYLYRCQHCKRLMHGRRLPDGTNEFRQLGFDRRENGDGHTND